MVLSQDDVGFGSMIAVTCACRTCAMGFVAAVIQQQEPIAHVCSRQGLPMPAHVGSGGQELPPLSPWSSTEYRRYMS
jgi:hypothetical protein